MDKDNIMKNLWDVTHFCITMVGGGLGYFIGGFDGLVVALEILVCLDYATGLMCAAADKCLSSEIGFKGLCRKILIFMMVGVGHIFDEFVIARGSALRTAVIFFYMSNEGLSLIENAAHLGLPIPWQIKDALEQVRKATKKKPSSKDKDKDI